MEERQQLFQKTYECLSLDELRRIAREIESGDRKINGCVKAERGTLPRE